MGEIIREVPVEKVERVITVLLVLLKDYQNSGDDKPAPAARGSPRGSVADAGSTSTGSPCSATRSPKSPRLAPPSARNRTKLSNAVSRAEDRSQKQRSTLKRLQDQCHRSRVRAGNRSSSTPPKRARANIHADVQKYAQSNLQKFDTGFVRGGNFPRTEKAMYNGPVAGLDHTKPCPVSARRQDAAYKSRRGLGR